MKKHLLIVGLIGALITVTSCSTAEQNETKVGTKVDNALVDLRIGKEEATKDLRKLREDVAVELTRIEEKLKDPTITEADRTKWEAERSEMDKLISRLDKNLIDVEAAT
ncbi:MAG: hypothetical protein IPI00_15265 [Flavobacteriales bacterium]|nr:hypothetical protein [Flavobacteriales bacterium]MBK6945371.1 hypothetical protein [Flavobacteriales bacterium]MBK7241484.1 hypothetical protein [Flavobacteriales bacterium]MBK7298473.1 hypothetical protein [Flavobacteriales bacterium]MBK9535071.1 hypothetical protein [Flavobacteriales bacterium]